MELALISLQVSISEATGAQFSVPSFEPTNNEFFFGNLMGRMLRSTAMLSISRRPSARDRSRPSQWFRGAGSLRPSDSGRNPHQLNHLTHKILPYGVPISVDWDPIRNPFYPSYQRLVVMQGLTSVPVNRQRPYGWSG